MCYNIIVMVTNVTGQSEKKERDKKGLSKERCNNIWEWEETVSENCSYNDNNIRIRV